jgi:hypothetical protein
VHFIGIFTYMAAEADFSGYRSLESVNGKQKFGDKFQVKVNLR